MPKTHSPHKILFPLNRHGRRFLRTINKIRLFFYDEPVSCIPCTENFMNVLFSTKNMKLNKVRMISKEVVFKHEEFYSPKQTWYYLTFVGSKDKRLKLLADYLRTEVSDLGDGKYGVRLPYSIANFIKKNKINSYINSKYSSLEEQVKDRNNSFREFKKTQVAIKD